jgi:hypothetical protein
MSAQNYKGGKFYKSTTAVTSDLAQAAYEALTYVEVPNVVSTPAMAVEDNIISQDYLSTDVSQKQKGFANVTDGELVVGYTAGDAGHAAMIAAAQSRIQYAFKSELSDSPNPVTTTNTVRYTRGFVGGGGDAGGGGEDFVNLTFSLAFNQRPIWVAPEAI